MIFNFFRKKKIRLGLTYQAGYEAGLKQAKLNGEGLEGELKSLREEMVILKAQTSWSRTFRGRLNDFQGQLYELIKEIDRVKK